MVSGWKRGVGLLPVGAAFLLGGCVWQSDYDKLDAENQQLKSEIARLTNAIRFTVNSDLLFKSGSWQMSQDGQEVVAKLASQLAPGQRRHLVVNGYTDSQPVGRGLQQKGITSNEQLSQKRAEAVMQYLISQGVKPNMVSAKGWGAQQPIASNGTAQGRAQNRRVEITTE